MSLQDNKSKNILNYESFLVGRSRLSAALMELLPNANYLEKNDLSKLINNKDHYLPENSIIFYTSAVTDPSLDTNLINKVNYLTPITLHQCISSQSKLITFGTVLERLYPNLNSYVISKNCLNEYSKKFQNFLHFQLHTLYGIGKPKSHMFLGQIYDSIKNKKKLRMTSGMQYREYQNINLVANEILNRIFIEDTEKLITFGLQVRLKDIAKNIFNHFQLNDLLEITENIDSSEIYDERIFQKNTKVSHPDVFKDLNLYLEREL
tara:strand:+ start:490 stop:1281 length:792 start_codon:yes stop_codon:yes gene_type:complete